MDSPSKKYFCYLLAFCVLQILCIENLPGKKYLIELTFGIIQQIIGKL